MQQVYRLPLKFPAQAILIVSLQTTNAQLGADIINKFMEEYAGYSIEQKIKSSDQIIAFNRFKVK
jgi:hypothetical protein